MHVAGRTHLRGGLGREEAPAVFDEFDHCVTKASVDLTGSAQLAEEMLDKHVIKGTPCHHDRSRREQVALLEQATQSSCCALLKRLVEAINAEDLEQQHNQIRVLSRAQLVLIQQQVAAMQRRHAMKSTFEKLCNVRDLFLFPDSEQAHKYTTLFSSW